MHISQTSIATSEPNRSRRRLLVGSVLAAIVCAGALLATSPGLPMVWDEGNAILRAEGILRWFYRWQPGADGPGPLSREAIENDWLYTVPFEKKLDAYQIELQGEGHPAFYGIVITAGRCCSWTWLAPLDAARFGPMMLFAVAAGAMFYRMGRDYSIVAAVGAVAALMLMPRLFAHAHFASFDGPLTSCWILAWATFAPARKKWPAAVLWGIMLGMTLSCKAPGWFAPLPFIAWAAIYRDRSAAKALAIGIPTALATFFLLNPPLWHQPIHGWAEFFDLNLHRAARLQLNIPIQFLGEIHHLGNPLPWYNTLFWTAVTVPVGTLLLAGIGLAAVFRRCRTDRAGILLVGNWLVLLIVRAVPGTPPHDGMRLFLPSFAMLAALAGIGCGTLLSWAATRWPNRLRARAVALVSLGLLFAGSASSLVWYAPHWLSYYNLLIGGLPGATAAGMEPTYYWDGLDRSVFDWLDENTEENQNIWIRSPSLENLVWMHRRKGTQFDPVPGAYRWYVLQNRPGDWPPDSAERRLMEEFTPAMAKTIRTGGWGPWRLDVPLVAVYDFRQYFEASQTQPSRDSRGH